MRVYHREGGGRPLRLLWTLEELGVPYELVTMTKEEAAAPEYLARHPLGRVPAWEDEHGVIFESTALCLHVADLHPSAGLLPPPGDRDRGLAYQWMFFSMTEIEAPGVELRSRREDAPETTAAVEERVRRAVAAVDDAIQGKEFIVADRFTVADVTTSACVSFAARVAGIELTGDLAAYVDSMARRRARVKAAELLKLEI